MPAWILALSPILDKVLGSVLPDPQARSKAITDILNVLVGVDLAQIGVNTKEAENDSVFVAGWRPFIGWVCGCSLAYQYVITPITLWLAAICGVFLPTPPRLDDILWELMFGMLGMGALRSFDKIKGTAK